MSVSTSRALQVVVLVAIAAACAPRGTRGPVIVPEPADESASADAATVKAEDIERTSEQSIEKLLEGRVAGVSVQRMSDGSIAVRIRGVSSFYGSNEPLYVLDGTPIQAGPGGALTGLNPHDIESIRVLKDPADTAIWGVRGANGVIVIKTKKPGRRNQ